MRTDNIKKKKAGIIEVFSSFQGEGPLAGIKQIFVRFAGCNLACSFCDVPGVSKGNLLGTGELLKTIDGIEREHGPHHSVSLTGGEPLGNVGYLKELLPVLRRTHKIYLETNGTLPGALEEVIGMVDWVAMDIKLPSSTGEKARWEENELFLKTAEKKNVFVKTVITAKTATEDLKKAAKTVAKVNRAIVFVLQPVTPPDNAGAAAPGIAVLCALRKAVNGILDDVRVIPQMHKILGIR